jgi:hypothetical protein
MPAIWDLPAHFNPSHDEGRKARAAGKPMIHRYGESLSGKNWEEGWKAEDRISTVPVEVVEIIPIKPSFPAERQISVKAEKTFKSETQVNRTGKRGRQPSTGIFETREELESALKSRSTEDVEVLSQEYKVSVGIVEKILGLDILKKQNKPENAKKGRQPLTGIFETRGELEEAVRARSSEDPEALSKAFGVSVGIIQKILK